MGNFLPMRILLRSRQPLGRFAPNFHGTLVTYARRWYSSLVVFRCELQKLILGFPMGKSVGRSPHAYFASFSTTTGSICLKLSQYMLVVCPQMLFEFDSVLMRAAKVDFWPCGSKCAKSFFSFFSVQSNFLYNRMWIAGFVYYKSGGCSIQSPQQRTFKF